MVTFVKIILLIMLHQCTVFSEQCQDVSVTACETSADCKCGYCCVNPVRPIGKRDNPSALTCQPLGHENDECLVRWPVYNASDVYFICPCVTGLHCKGNGHFDIPMGELGNCVSY